MDLVFDDLNETERRIHELRGDIGYLSLCEILDRQNDLTLVRVDFSVSQLGGYLRDDRPPLSRSERERMPADDEPEEEEDDEDDDRGPRLSDLCVPDSSLPSLEQLARAAMRWIKHTCAGFMVGETVRDFKIRVFSAKGHKTIHARRFTVRDLDRERAAKAPVAAPAPIAVALTPTVVPIKPEPGRSEAMPEARAWRASSDGYTNLIGLIQPSYAHLATLQNAALSNQQGEIQQLREGLETLTGELVKLRVGLAEVDQESRAEVAKQERQTLSVTVPPLSSTRRIASSTGPGAASTAIPCVILDRLTPSFAASPARLPTPGCRIMACHASARASTLVCARTLGTAARGGSPCSLIRRWTRRSTPRSTPIQFRDRAALRSHYVPDRTG